MQQFTLVELWSHMGLFARLVVYLLGVMSVLAALVAAERLVAFRRAGAASRRAAAAVAEAIAGQGLDAAAQRARPADPGHLGRVLGAGLQAYLATTAAHGSPDLVVESTARALERQAAREVDGLRRGLHYLASVGATAPFIGLLGTVVGIIDAFHAMAEAGAGGLATVSAGISEALVTTALGLLVAIPAVLAYNHLLSWVDRAAVDLSESSNELLDAVALRVDPEARAAAARAG